MGFFDKIKAGLAKTKEAMSGSLNAVLSTFRTVDEDLLMELEDAMILADLGVGTAEEVVEELRRQAKLQAIQTEDQLKSLLRSLLQEKMTENTGILLDGKPAVILMIGVNGVGKTTTAGKLAARYVAEGKKVLLGAADTFRAAAADQLAIWAHRAGADLVRHEEGADPAAVVFDAISAAKARGCDVVICDTAGRLHNKKNLLNELAKIDRVIERELPGQRHETLLVLDATTGQNALQQARQFNEVAALSGLVLTKLDGTAKGGIVVAVSRELSVPVKLVGVGEGVDDLIDFDAGAFMKALIPDENGENG